MITTRTEKPRYTVRDWRGEIVVVRFRYQDAEDRARIHANATMRPAKVFGPDGRIKWTCQPATGGYEMSTTGAES